MAGEQETVVRWDQELLPIWLRRLVRLASREGGDYRLCIAWSRVDDLSGQLGWAVQGVAPIARCPHGHQWAAMASTPAADLVSAHGATPREALELLYSTMAGVDTG